MTYNLKWFWLLITMSWCLQSHAADRFWIAGSASNWNDVSNWSLTSGGIGGASVPGASDVAIFNNNGSGNCLLDIAPTVEALSIIGYVGSIDLNGEVFTISGSSDNTFNGVTINDGMAGGSLNLSSTGNTTLLNSIFNCSITATSAQITVNSNTFNGITVLEKSGINNSSNNNDNTFNAATTLVNSSSALLRFGNAQPDVFNAQLTLTNTGNNNLQIAHAAIGTVFNGNIFFNKTGDGSISIGEGASATSATLASGFALNIGSGGFNGGSLIIEYLNQLGTTAQTLVLTDSSRLQLVNCTFAGDVNFSAPRYLINQNTFSSGCSLTYTGSVGETSAGGNTFQGTTTLSHSGSATLTLANSSADTFNGILNVNSTSTGTMRLAHASTGNQFNNNVIISSTGPGNIRFGNAGGTSSLANGFNFSVGAGGFVDGVLEIDNFTTGVNAQTLTLNSDAFLQLTGCTFGGSINFTAPRITFNNNSVAGAATLTKTGPITDFSQGGNAYNSNVVYNLTDASAWIVGNTLNDTFAANVEINLTSSGSFYLNSNTTVNVAGNLAVNTSGTGGVVYLSNAAASALTVNGNLNVDLSGTISGTVYLGNSGDLTVNGTTTILNNGSGTTSQSIITNSASSDVIFNAAVTITNSGTANTTRINFGNTGNVTANSTVTINNTSTSTNSSVFVNSSGVVNFNDSLIITSTGLDCDGFSFGSSGTVNFASGAVLTIGAAGFTDGSLIIRNLVQAGADAISLNLTSNAVLSLTSCTVIGTVNAVAPRIAVASNVFTDEVTLTKTGGTNDNSSGGNVFLSDFTLNHQGSNQISFTTASADTFGGNVIIANSGDGNVSFAQAGQSLIVGNLTISNSANGTGVTLANNNGSLCRINGNLIFANTTANSANSYIGNGGDVIVDGITSITSSSTSISTIWIAQGGTSTVTLNGATTILTSGSGTTERIYLSNSGSMVLNGTLTVEHNSTATNSGFFIGHGGSVAFNANVSLACGTNDGVFFGNNNGNTTLGASANLSIAAAGFNGNRLQLRNVTHPSTTALILSNTATDGNIEFFNSSFGGNVSATAGVITTRISTFSGTFQANVNGTLAVTSFGGNVFSGNVTYNFTGIGTTNYICGNNDINTYNGNLTVTVNAPRTVVIAQNNAGTVVAGNLLLTNNNVGSLLFVNTASAGATVSGTCTLINTSTGNIELSDDNGAALTLNGDVFLENTSTGGIRFGNEGGTVAFGAASSLSATGTGFNEGTLQLRNCTFNFSGATSLTLGGSNPILDLNGSTFTGNLTAISSRIISTSSTYNGTANFTISGSTTNNWSGNTFNGNLTLNRTGGGNNLALGNGTADVANANVVLSNSSTGNIIWANSSSGNNITGNITATNSSSGAIFIGNSGTYGATISGTALFEQTGTGNIYIANNSTGTVQFNGNIAIGCNNTGRIVFGNSLGITVFGGSTTLSISGLGFSNGTLILRGINQAAAVAHTLALTGTSALQLRDNTFNGSLNLTAPSFFFRDNQFNGVTNFTKTGSTTESNDGGNTFNADVVFNLNGGLWRMVSNGAFTDTYNGNVTLNYVSGTGYEFGRNGNVNLAGNLTLSGNVNFDMGNAGGTINFTGGNAQTLSIGSGSPTLLIRRLVMNKSANALSLGMPVNVNTSLTLTQGIIQTDATNFITMTDNSTVSGANNSSYIDGPITKVGNDAFTFPVGDGGVYAPISISAPASTATQFTAQYFLGSPWPSYSGGSGTRDSTIDHISSREYWILDRSGSTSSATVTLSWDTRSGGINNLGELIVARWNGTQWVNEGNGGTTGDTLSGSIATSGAISNFSPFTLASSSTNNPLPVNLIGFDINARENSVYLNWQTASELNSDYFEIERKTIKGIASICRVQAKGTSSALSKYACVDDAPELGLNHYRIVQYDFDGTAHIYPWKAIEFGIEAFQLSSIYPNPIKRGQNLSLIGYELQRMPTKITLVSTDGKRLPLENQFDEITIPYSIASGLYLLELQTDNGEISLQRLVITP